VRFQVVSSLLTNLCPSRQPLELFYGSVSFLQAAKTIIKYDPQSSHPLMLYVIAKEPGLGMIPWHVLCFSEHNLNGILGDGMASPEVLKISQSSVPEHLAVIASVVHIAQVGFDPQVSCHKAHGAGGSVFVDLAADVGMEELAVGYKVVQYCSDVEAVHLYNYGVIISFSKSGVRDRMHVFRANVR